MKKYKSQTIETKQGIIQYSDTGTGPVILSIHGAMGGYDQSELLAKTVLGSGYRVIAVSRPGYLETPLSSGPTWQEQSELCKALIEKLMIKRVSVLAISGGGPCAMHFAQKYPELCSRLILCSTIASPMKTKTPLHFKLMTGLAKWPWLMKSMQKSTEKNFSKTLKRVIANNDVRQKTFENHEILTLIRENMVGMFDNVAQRIEGTNNDIEQRETFTFQFEKINAPALVVHGKEDSIAEFASNGKILAEKIPGAKKLFFNDGEHVSIFTHRDTIMEQVRLFLSEE